MIFLRNFLSFFKFFLFFCFFFFFFFFLVSSFFFTFLVSHFGALRSAALCPSIQDGLQRRCRKEARASLDKAPAEAPGAAADDGDGIESAKVVSRRCL